MKLCIHVYLLKCVSTSNANANKLLRRLQIFYILPSYLVFHIYDHLNVHGLADIFNYTNALDILKTAINILPLAAILVL